MTSCTLPLPVMAPLFTLPHRNGKNVSADVLKKGYGTVNVTVYSQPDCNIGWDSHRERWYFSYDLYMLTASDSENDLPAFPFLSPASRHDSIGFLYNWYSMKQFLPETNTDKPLPDSAHDAMAYYEYCRDNIMTPFIDLSGKGGRPSIYKDDFTINNDGGPVCREGHTMRRNSTESIKGRPKFKCPKISFTGRNPHCTCENPCSDAKYSRPVHLVMADNPRLFNDPPRSSEKWKQGLTQGHLRNAAISVRN